LHKGTLKKIVEESNRVTHKPHLFLLSDILLFAKEKAKKLAYVDHIPIHACLICAQDKTANSFTLARLDNKEKLVIFVNTDEERESWTHAITVCMSENTKALWSGMMPYNNEV